MMMNGGILFNIQKFSIHDGPGIRTVVFFRGCPLRCGWCSNPESQDLDVRMLWDPGKCRHCLRCLEVCPQGAVESPGDRIRIDHRRCTGCGDCVSACPGKALSPAGRTYSLDEVVEICLQDRVFYEESGGGVTLSGGEVLAQSGFARELLIRFRDAGIHRAMETSGFAPPEVFRGIAELCDLILFDIKHHNQDRHREGTGVAMGLIMENFRAAVSASRQVPAARVLPRIPVIPGYNDGLEDAAAFADLLNAAGPMNPEALREVQLLPFHQFGQNKYAMLGRDYGFEKTKALHEEDLESYRAVFKDRGIRAF